MISTDAQKLIAATEALAENEIGPAAIEWSMGLKPASGLYRKASELGLTGIEVPVQHGGKGFDFDVKVAACEALASADFGFSMSLVNTHNVALRLCLSASGPVRDYYLPSLLNGTMSACTALTEPSVGSDFGAVTTLATETANGWIINGEKKWIVNARHAGLAIVFAQCLEPGNRDGIGAFVIDLQAEGVRRYAIDSVFSQTSIGTGGFTLDNIKVDSDHLLLAPGTAFKSILNEINNARTYVAAMCNAMLDKALQEVRSYGQRRLTFGQPLSAHESWQRSIREAQADLDTAKSLTAEAIKSDGTDTQLAAITAKVESVTTCQRHLPELLHAMGAEGLLAKYCFTRHLAAAQIAGFTDGATNLLRDRAAVLKAT